MNELIKFLFWPLGMGLSFFWWNKIDQIISLWVRGALVLNSLLHWSKTFPPLVRTRYFQIAPNPQQEGWNNFCRHIYFHKRLMEIFLPKEFILRHKHICVMCTRVPITWFFATLFKSWGIGLLLKFCVTQFFPSPQTCVMRS